MLAEFAGIGPELAPLPERKPINEKARESHPKPSASNTSSAKTVSFADTSDAQSRLPEEVRLKEVHREEAAPRERLEPLARCHRRAGRRSARRRAPLPALDDARRTGARDRSHAMVEQREYAGDVRERLPVRAPQLNSSDSAVPRAH